ncbi:hypothetical protein OV203_45390 [Nannocystis sp. ILAH1]|uniref:hypothetical protein n=1 Tax=Nannocystis sp. ILAH1 TaxID=2996789 RepID=UPI002271FFA6|nr:hypothetical protein [Nannocystis sp. ILAH1]MCY0994443.1 hypothetical protein [Nannocystis sp. ILAH1]
MRASVIVGALLCGCVRAEPPAGPAGAGQPAAGAGAPAGAAGEAAASNVRSEPGAVAEPNGKEPPPPQQGVDGRCEPTPKTGDPCRAGDGYCVLSWGEPGGYSEALWCRDGRWQLEQERNLP